MDREHLIEAICEEINSLHGELCEHPLSVGDIRKLAERIAGRLMPVDTCKHVRWFDCACGKQVCNICGKHFGQAGEGGRG